MAETPGRQRDADGGDALSAFIAELEQLRGAFEIARSCLRYAYKANLAERQFDSSAVLGLDNRSAIVQLVGGKVASVLTEDVVAQLVELVRTSVNPPLAAWSLADAVAIAVSQDFTAHLQQSDGSSEPELVHLDAYSIYPEACRKLYGPGTAFSERAGVDRDPSNPTQVSGLALWIDEISVRSRYRVIVDKAGGSAFNAGLNGAGLNIALVQPNRRLEELNVDWLSDEGDENYRFFGVTPQDSAAQRSVVADSVSAAGRSGATVVLLPELTMTKAHAAELAGVLGSGGATPGRPNVIVTGSFHEAVDDATRRNTAYVHFRDFVLGVATRAHYKMGKFTFPMSKEALVALVKGDSRKGDNAAEELSWTVGKAFREDITRPREIRLYAGTDFSAVVLICADFIDQGVHEILQRLRPSLVLICNMTPKVDGFDDAARGLIRAGQTTTVMVNNPALWPAGDDEVLVEGALACMPVRPRTKSTASAIFPEGAPMLLFNPRLQGFRLPESENESEQP